MLNRRLQVLIDDERWERLQRRSAETGASVGELVRRAIDNGLPPGRENARAALASFLDSPRVPVGDWATAKLQMLDDFGELPQ
jgi:hypothetical protein